MWLAEFNHYLEVEGDVFLLGSQFMASATALISKLFVPYHANWWDPSWAINSSPEVHFCCVWGVCCHPHEFCIAASRLLTSLQPQILVVPRVSSHNTENNCRGGWRAELPKASLISACPTPKQLCQGEGQRKLQAVPRLRCPERTFCSVMVHWPKSGVLVSFAVWCCNLSNRKKRKSPFTWSWPIFCVFVCV